MKGFFKLYAILSVAFISLVMVLVAIYPNEFLNVVEELLRLYDNKESLLSIYTSNLPVVETLYTYLIGLYLANLVVNIVVWVFAYLSEDKFNNRIVLMSLVINIIYFSILFYTAKLLVESVYRLIRRK